jgi:hypothetical protein
MTKFSELSKEAQDYIDQRFEQHGMSGEHAFDNTNIFTEEVKDLSNEDMIAYLRKKDISHINPQSDFPDQSDNYDNVYLEDASINRERGAEIATEGEIEDARIDQVEDTKDLDVDEDGVQDISGDIDDDDDLIEDIFDLFF